MWPVFGQSALIAYCPRLWLNESCCLINKLLATELEPSRFAITDPEVGFGATLSLYVFAAKSSTLVTRHSWWQFMLFLRRDWAILISVGSTIDWHRLSSPYPKQDLHVPINTLTTPFNQSPTSANLLNWWTPPLRIPMKSSFCSQVNYPKLSLHPLWTDNGITLDTKQTNDLYSKSIGSQSSLMS